MRFSLLSFMSLFICVSSHTGHDDNPAVHDLFDDKGVHNGTVFDDNGVHDGTAFDDNGVHDLFDDNGVHDGTAFDDKGVHNGTVFNGTVFDDKNSTSNPFVSSELNHAFSGTLALSCLFMVFM